MLTQLDSKAFHTELKLSSCMTRRWKISTQFSFVICGLYLIENWKCFLLSSLKWCYLAMILAQETQTWWSKFNDSIRGNSFTTLIKTIMELPGLGASLYANGCSLYCWKYAMWPISWWTVVKSSWLTEVHIFTLKFNWNASQVSAIFNCYIQSLLRLTVSQMYSRFMVLS